MKIKKTAIGILYCIIGAAFGASFCVILSYITSNQANFILYGITGGIPGLINGFLAGYYDVYSHNHLGFIAFIFDSSWSLPMTCIGLIFLLYLKIRKLGSINSEYTKQINGLLFINAGDSLWKSKGLALGNIVSVRFSSENHDFLYVSRHELVHIWQYRIGTILSFLKLIQEQVMGKYGFNIYDPYATNWNLEYQASKLAARMNHNRPWFFKVKECDKLY